jgi:post-segregation antitoxin (ccd killing protein)
MGRSARPGRCRRHVVTATLLHVRTSIRQNVTLSVPRDLLKEARIVAAQRGISLSALMVEGLKRAVRDEERLEQAGRRIQKRLRLGFDLGTRGLALPARSGLHER